MTQLEEGIQIATYKLFGCKKEGGDSVHIWDDKFVWTGLHDMYQQLTGDYTYQCVLQNKDTRVQTIDYTTFERSLREAITRYIRQSYYESERTYSSYIEPPGISLAHDKSIIITVEMIRDDNMYGIISQLEELGRLSRICHRGNMSSPIFILETPLYAARTIPRGGFWYTCEHL